MESFAGALTSAEEHNLQHEVLSADEVNNRFPGYNFPSHFKALYQPQGGYLESELAIKTHVSMAEKLGADVMVESPISRWEVLPDGRVKVETSENVYYTNKLVLSAGAWMHKLVPELTVRAHGSRPPTGPEVQDQQEIETRLLGRACCCAGLCTRETGRRLV